MASPLKTLVLRLPCQAGSRTAGFVRTSPKASFSTVRSLCLAQTPALRPQCIASSIPKTFAQANQSANKSTAVNAERPAAAAAAAAGAQHDALDWDSFFKLRVKRRRVQLLFSVTTSLLSGGFGAVVLSTGVAEPIITQIPLDPIMTLGLMTFAFSGMGWLAGPSIGNQVFYAMNRKWKKQIVQKEAEFFARVKKHRVDPTNSSAGNPGTFFFRGSQDPKKYFSLTTFAQFPTFTEKRFKV